MSKDKIINGTLTKEEAITLYKTFEIDGMQASEKSKMINNFLEDLNKNISKENYHKFVATLLEAEVDIVKERNPLEKNQCAQYLRNTSLAKNAFNIECQKENFGQDVCKALKTENEQKALDIIANVHIPNPIVDHYKNIVEPFYKANNDTKGASVNLVFHGLTTSVKTNLEQEDSKLFTKYNKLSALVYERAAVNPEGYKNSYDAIDAKITGKELTAERSANLKKNVQKRFDETKVPAQEQRAQPVTTEHELSFVQKFVQKIKSFIQKFSTSRAKNISVESPKSLMSSASPNNTRQKDLETGNLAADKTPGQANFSKKKKGKMI